MMVVLVVVLVPVVVLVLVVVVKFVIEVLVIGCHGVRDGGDGCGAGVP